MMTKENFVAVMKQIKRLEEYQDKIDEVFSLRDWPISEIAVEIASIVARDCGDYDDGWFNLLTVDYICEYEWGTNYRGHCLVEDIDTGEKFSPTSFEELYDVIQYWYIKSKKKEENND